MRFRILASPSQDALSYLLGDRGEAVVIDPVPGIDALVRALLTEYRLKLVLVLHTHLHHGRTSCARELATACNVRIGAGVRAAAIATSLPLAEGETVRFGRERLQVLDTPGHTPGCVSYLWRDRLFCGDALDVAGCAAGDSEADIGTLHDSLMRKIFSLPDETLLFPAHPVKGRYVSLVIEERTRHARRGGLSRDQLLSDMVLHRHRPGSSAARNGSA